MLFNRHLMRKNALLFFYFCLCSFHWIKAQNSLNYLSSTTGAACYAIAASNGFLYAGAGNTLQVYSSSGIPPFTLLFEHRFTSNIAAIKVKGSKLFVAANHAGISMWDLSTPSLPLLLDEYEPDSLNEAVYDIAFKGDSIFASYKTKMALFLSAGNSLSLLQKFAYQSGNSLVRGCEVKGNYLAFTTAYGSNSQTGIHLLNASNLIPYFFYPQNFCDPEDVIFGQSTNLLHVLGGTESWFNTDPRGLFYSLSIANPYQPQLNFIDTIKGITYLAVAQPQRAQIINDTVYVASVAAYNTTTPFPLSGNVLVYDATVLSNEHKLTDIYAGLWHFDLAIDQHKMYVASEWYGIKTLDISNIYNEQDLGNTLTGGWNTSADKYHNKLVVANEGYGFKLFDIASLTQPQLIDTSNAQGFCYGVSFSTDGNYIYGYFYTGADFRIYDSQTLNQIAALDINVLPTTTDWLDAQVWQSKAINVEVPSLSQKKICILDVSNPLQPLIDTQFVAPQVNDILVNSDGKLFIANNGSIQIYDLQTRTMLVNLPLLFQNVTAIAFYNDTLYANVDGIFPGFRKYIYQGGTQLNYVNTMSLAIPNPKFIAADAFGIYLDYQQQGVVALNKSSLAPVGYYKHSLEFYRPDQWGQKMMMCKDSLILLSEYFGQTSLLSNYSGVLGVEKGEQLSDPEILVFPNPSSKLINVSINKQLTATIQLNLLNLNGKQLLSKSYPVSELETTCIQLDCSGLTAGYYLLQLKIENKWCNKRIVVLN